MSSPTKATPLPVSTSALGCQVGSWAAAAGTCAVLLTAFLVVPNASDRFGDIPMVAPVARQLQQQEQQTDTTSRLSTPAMAAFDSLYAKYLARHNSAIALLDDASLTEEQSAELLRMRFVVVTVCKLGLGNRLPGLVTAFALALVTRRVLLIRDKDNLYFRVFEPSFDCKLTYLRELKLQKTGNFSAASLRLPERVAELLLEDVAAVYANATVLQYSCCDYEMPLLQGNALYRHVLGQFRPAFPLLGRPLLVLRPGLQEQALAVYQRHVPTGFLVVGVQMRTRKRPANFPPIRRYADLALAIGLQLAPVNRLRFFVASDSRAAISEFQDAVRDTLASDWNVSGTATVFSSGADVERIDGAIVDMRLLGMANETVITYGSSFGYVAAAWANRPPHYLQHTYQKHLYRDQAVIGGRRVTWEDRVADDHVYFWKAVVAEPCYWDSKPLLTGALSRNDSALHGRLVAAFKSNVYWMQYSQCQWNTLRP